MKILTSEQMRNIDRRTTERFGIPSIVLMENAAIAVVDAIHEHYPNADRVAIFCGTGANGGDGLAVARHLENRGVVPMVILVGDRAKLAGDALTKFSAFFGGFDADAENLDFLGNVSLGFINEGRHLGPAPRSPTAWCCTIILRI